MNTIEIVILIYFIVGLILAFLWYRDEYAPKYEYDEENNEDVEIPMVILFILALVVFWPIKFLKNYFEGFVE